MAEHFSRYSPDIIPLSGNACIQARRRSGIAASVAGRNSQESMADWREENDEWKRLLAKHEDANYYIYERLGLDNTESARMNQWSEDIVRHRIPTVPGMTFASFEDFLIYVDSLRTKRMISKRR